MALASGDSGLGDIPCTLASSLFSVEAAMSYISFHTSAPQMFVWSSRKLPVLRCTKCSALSVATDSSPPSSSSSVLANGPVVSVRLIPRVALSPSTRTAK